MRKNNIALFAALSVACLAATASASAQSIGFSFKSNGNFGGLYDDGEADSLAPEDLAGVPGYAQTNWNNLGRYGLVNPGVVTNSFGNAVSLALNWDAGWADTTGTAAGIGGGDGKLMDGFLYSWGPGPASTLQSSIYGNPINNKPLMFVSGLSTWYSSEGAEGYGVVLYTTGYSYYEVGEYWIQSVTGNPFNNSMAGGPDLSSHIFVGDTGPYTGTYIQATGTSAGSATFGANYVLFSGFTNDAVVIRNAMPSGGYGSGLNAIQFFPIFPSPPTASTPTFSPSDTVYAGEPVTVAEAATGDPFHPELFYQWQTDGGGGGALTNIPTATNATLNVVPANAVSAYSINYQVIVTNSFGSVTSSVATLTVNPAVAPFVTQDTTPGAGSSQATVYAYAGGTVSFSAAFGGTPSTYLWQSNGVNISGATSTTLTLADVQLYTSASYALTATNSVGGIASTPSTLTVLSPPPAPDSSVPYAYDVYTNNPKAYWRLGETIDNVGNSVQAYDSSGHNYHGTYGIAASDNQPGPQSPSYSGFESTNTGVTLTHNVNSSFVLVPALNLNTNTVTVTAWIYPTVNQNPYNGILVWANGSDKAGFGFGGNTAGSGGMAELGYVWDTNSPATYNFHSGLYPPANIWSFVALTITPTNTTIYLYYVDSGMGVTNLLKSVQTINHRVEPFSGGTTWIGSDTSSARTFGGTLDEVAVFAQSLSEVQLQDLFLKGIGALGVAPTVSDATIYPASSVYSGQNVRLTASVNATVPITMKWQSSPDGSTWSDVPGANSASLLVNPLTVNTIHYHLVASNPVGSGTNNDAPITFTALPPAPAGQWTVNYQITNNVLSFATTSSGLGHYTGRGILGGGSYWNVLPDTAGSFVGMNNLTSPTDFQDDGATHSGIYCTMLFVGGFSSASAPQPDSSDIGNLLNQMVQCWTATNELQFHGVPDGTYNVCLYGCDGTFADRGTTFVVHDALNGDHTAGTVNASPIVPLQEGVNFVVFTNVHVSGGTLNVDCLPTPVVPSHNPNTEADFNGAQLQLVSYDVAPPAVLVNETQVGANVSVNWSQGILQTATNAAGPWTPLYAPSPVTVGLTNAAQFFRVLVHP